MILQKQHTQFLWRVLYSHVIAYFIAGIFAVTFMNYKEHYASDYLNHLMLAVTSPRVALGPALQIFRGLIIGLVLLPIRKMILEEKYGFAKLALLVLGLSFISTIGPTPGSFEGFVYTVLPVQYHLLGIPETVLYIFLFIFILWFTYKREKRWIFIVSIVFVVLICFMSIMGYLSASGLL